MFELSNVAAFRRLAISVDCGCFHRPGEGVEFRVLACPTLDAGVLGAEGRALLPVIVDTAAEAMIDYERARNAV